MNIAARSAPPGLSPLWAKARAVRRERILGKRRPGLPGPSASEQKIASPVRAPADRARGTGMYVFIAFVFIFTIILILFLMHHFLNAQVFQLLLRVVMLIIAVIFFLFSLTQGEYSSPEYTYSCLDDRVYLKTPHFGGFPNLTNFLDSEGKPYSCTGFCKEFPSRCAAEDFSSNEGQ
jgi:hypothetical protein